MMTMLEILKRLKGTRGSDFYLIQLNQLETITPKQIPPSIVAQMLYSNGFSLAFKRALFSMLTPFQIFSMLFIDSVKAHLFTQLNPYQVVAILEEPTIPDSYKQKLIDHYAVPSQKIICMLLRQRQGIKYLRGNTTQEISRNIQQADSYQTSSNSIPKMPHSIPEVPRAPLKPSADLLRATEDLLIEIDDLVDELANNSDNNYLRLKIANKISSLKRMSKNLSFSDMVKAIEALQISVVDKSAAKITSEFETVVAIFNQHVAQAENITINYPVGLKC